MHKKILIGCVCCCAHAAFRRRTRVDPGGGKNHPLGLVYRFLINLGQAILKTADRTCAWEIGSFRRSAKREGGFGETERERDEKRGCGRRGIYRRQSQSFASTRGKGTPERVVGGSPLHADKPGAHGFLVWRTTDTTCAFNSLHRHACRRKQMQMQCDAPSFAIDNAYAVMEKLKSSE